MNKCMMTERSRKETENMNLKWIKLCKKQNIHKSQKDKKEKFHKKISMCLMVSLLACLFSGCGVEQQQEQKTDSSFQGGMTGETIKILSGSENKELAEILADCSKETGVNIEMTYKGSVDIMNILKDGAKEYDAVWPASSLWISLGDTQHVVKYDESISTSPVVFGIKESLAKQLGFHKGNVSVEDILEAIRSGNLTFCMTSATQSNSGASAYIGFLYALLHKEEALTEKDLETPGLKEDISKLLSGIDRSSGSSDWLKDMFLAGDYDAMVNYECLIIAANKELEAQGREPLYIVYPYDGLSLADSPLGYVDHGDKKKQEAFEKVQEYLLSEEAQNAIEQTGRRVSISGVSEENKDVFNVDWGIDTEKILSPITMPSEEVLMKALSLYQTSFRKPSLTVYCLDYSGSMAGEGQSQMVEALSQIFIQENAEKNLLQAEQEEINIIITFDDKVLNVYQAEDGSETNMKKLYESVEKEQTGSGTDMYVAAEEGLRILSENYQLENYTPAIILMTDGMSLDDNRERLIDTYHELGLDIPIFSIMFGQAESEQLEELAKVTNARVFDGRTNLISAFRSVKGYN